MTTRPPIHAGTWYPERPGELRRAIRAALSGEAAGEVLALVGPHAGLRFSGGIAGAAYGVLDRARHGRVVLIGPSHHAAYAGVALPGTEMKAYATPLGALPIDRGAVARLRGQPGFDGPAGAHLPEHSLEMHAIFLAAVLPGVPILPLIVGDLSAHEGLRSAARALRGLLGPRDLVVVSSDFTHHGRRFGYAPFREAVPERLLGLMDAALGPICRGDRLGFERHLETTGDTICGREPIRLLLELLPESARGERVAATTSGHMTGDFDLSVSYASVCFSGTGGWSSPGEKA